MSIVNRDISRREIIRTGATALLAGTGGISLLGCGGTVMQSGASTVEPQNDASTTTRMIGVDRRLAVVNETYYALRFAYKGNPNNVAPSGGSQIWDSECLGNWNYIGDDPNAFTVVQNIPGRENASVATDPQFSTSDGYGKKNGYGRGGQCTYFSCLILYRALNGFKFSTNASYDRFYWPDLTGSNYPSAGEAVPGDLVFKTSGVQHVAVCVGASNGSTIDVVDSNYFGTSSTVNTWEVGKLTAANGAFIAWSSEIIGRHRVPVSDYKMITGDAKKYTNLRHRRWYNL